ncbi:MAG: two-component system sensor histidine kinase NtrB [Planctomycetota bacterium]
MNSERVDNESWLRFGQPFGSIVESLPIGVVTFDIDLAVVDANAEAGRLIGLDDCIDKSLSKGTNNPGLEGLNWGEQLKATVSTGESQTFERVSYSLDGRTRLLRIVCLAVREEARRRIVGGTVLVEDITEKTDLQRRLAGAEKLASVGKLTSTVAHELNNPMDGILRYINLADRAIDRKKLDKPKEYLAQCRQGIMRMVRIVSELLEFSRSSHAPFEYVKIEHIIEDAIKTMAADADSCGVQIRREYAGDVPQIRGGNLFQVFCNLIKNALDAMAEGGELRITTCMKRDNTAVIEFRDTGTGFAPEHAEDIFEPFFTTKDKGKGTGLGLAVCRDIVERYDGRMTAENAVGGGSVFAVYLPIKEGSL